MRHLGKLLSLFIAIALFSHSANAQDDDSYRHSEWEWEWGDDGYPDYQTVDENAIAAGREVGMMTFDQRLLELVNEGLITEEAALEKSNNPEALTMNLKGIFLGTDSGIL